MTAKFDRSRFLKGAAALAAAPLVAKIPAPAYAEGARAEPLIVPPIDGRQWNVGYGFERAIQGYEHVYPTLAQAVAEWKKRGRPMAHDTAIFWNTREDLVMKFNYTQIIRHPYGVPDIATTHYGEAALRRIRQEQLHQHLAAVENVLKHGAREEWKGANGVSHYHACGGMCEFNGKTPILRPLRDLVLRTNQEPHGCGGYKEEWLSEFSLQVV